MKKPKLKYQEKNLSDEEVKQKRRLLGDLKMSLEALELQIELDKKMLALDLPTRKLKAQIRNEEEEMERTKANIKAIEKQIRTKIQKFNPTYV